MVVAAGTGQRADAQGDAASFWEIFKHAWPILFERPKPLLIFALSLGAAYQIVEVLREILQAPYQPHMDAFIEAQTSEPNAEAWAAMMANIKEIGYFRLGVSWALPFLMAPFFWLALCHASLSIWDGWLVGIHNVVFAVRKYMAGLQILVLITFFGVFLFLFSLLSLFPLLLVQGMGASMGGSMILTLLGVAAGLFFFCKILWPHLRRFIALQLLLYFRLVDGEAGPWFGRMWVLYETLKAFPSHMNQGVAVIIGGLLGASFLASLIVAMLVMAGVPILMASFIGKTLFILTLMWPLTALAGFHRLMLSPVELDCGPAGNDGARLDRCPPNKTS